MYASAGAQINGSWLNKIGEEAELLTRRILIRSLTEGQYIVAAILKDGSSRLDAEYLEDLVDKVDLLLGVRLNNQTSILFSSEPDLSLLNPAGEVVAVIEVKGGKDTAGALERYGAAKKSWFLRLFYGELILKCQFNKLRKRKLLKLRKPYPRRLISLSLLLIPSTVPLVVLPSK
jgi:hypothetical protein